MVRTSDRLTVIYLLDQSLSIPPERRAGDAQVRQCRGARGIAATGRPGGRDRFGRDAAIEMPPFDYDVQMATDRDAGRSASTPTWRRR